MRTNSAGKLKISLYIWCYLLGVLVPTIAIGQVNMATIVGRITDQAGAVVTKCEVTLRNEATNVTLKTTSNIDGDYVLPNILPGMYEIDVSANGFSRYVISNIVVDVGQTVRGNVSLSIGAMSTAVKVTSDQPLVQTDTSSIGSVVESKQIDQMPLNGRTNIFGLLAIAPGVQGAGANAKIAGSSSAGGYNETMDGVNDMNEENARLAFEDPSLDSMQEFKVVDSTGSAEYGPGTQQVIISTKQGTNQFHGSAFEYNRNTVLAARNYFSSSNTPYSRNEFGGSLGGPIKHNKIFFFGSFEGLEFHSTRTSITAQATANLLNGNFAGLKTIIDPTTQIPFPNNQIPTTSFNSVSKTLLSYFETANTQTSNPGGLGNNYTANLPSSEQDFRYEGRIDYTISSRDSIFLRYYYVTDTMVTPGSTALSGGLTFPYAAQSLAVNYTRIISPNATNVLTFGFERDVSKHLSQHTSLVTSSILPGIPDSFPGLGGLPTVSITGFTGIAENNGSTDTMPTTQMSDILTWIKGKHTLKGGFSFVRYQFDNRQIPSPSHGSLSFTGQYTGNAFADFLLGDLATSTEPLAPLESSPTNDRFGFFMQDDWQATPNLTINAGLRYDLPTLFENLKGGMANYYPNLQKLVVIKGNYDTSAFPALPIVSGQSVGLNTGNYIGNDLLQIQPRIGFAYRPFDNSIFVVRGGYGLYYNTEPWLYGSFVLATNPPFSGTRTFEPAAGKTPTLLLSNPFPVGSGTTPSGINITALPSKYSYPKTNQWNLTLESQVSSDIAFRATYLGSARWDSTYLDPINTPTLAPGPVQPRRPVPAFGDIALRTNGTTENTQMLQLSAIRRFKSGLSFGGEYAWTKQLINSVSDYTELTDPQNLLYDRGNDPGIRQQYFIGNYVFYLPFGSGHRFLSNLHGPLNILLGGWETSGIVTLASGLPYSVNFTSSVQGWTSNRADEVGDPHVSHPSLNEWFNPAAFALPTPFTYGNTGAYAYWGPGYSNWDTGVMKNFPVTERSSLQFRAEFFDALNHPSFSNPASNISVPSTVGMITATSDGPRIIQLALRLEF